MKIKNTEKRNNAALEKMVSDLNKKFGDNAVTLGFRKDEEGNIETLNRIPTGSFSLDIALGGGIPEGRITQISGAFSSTKTCQSAHVIANAQKMGYTCALVDVEHTSTPDFLEQIGVDIDNLISISPDSMEEATEAILQFQNSGLVHLAVLDSVAALSPNKEQSSTMDETIMMGVAPKLWGEFCRKFQMNNNRLYREGKTPFTLILINQLREKIGQYGDPEYTPGGRSLSFFSSVDLRLRRGDWIIEGKGENRHTVGQVVKFKTEKNKTYKRMQTGEFDFYFDENSVGVPKYNNDNMKEIVICAIEHGIITRAGAWFKYGDEKFQGLDKLVETLHDKVDILESIKNDILSKIKSEVN